MAAEQDYRQALITRHPFWQALSPGAVKQRIEQLLTAPDPAGAIQALSPVEYILLLKESPEARPQLLALAQPEQIRTVLDLDCWHKDTLQSARVLTWLEELQQSGGEPFMQMLYELDMELLIAVFRSHIRVHAALPSEEDIEPTHYDEVLANELYRVEFLPPDSPLQEHIRRLFATIRMVDLDFYHALMQNVMWGQDREAEEWAYRWKNGRLQDEGFPNYYEALETYRLLDLEPALPPATPFPPSPGMPASAETSGAVPAYAWSLTPAGSLLARALTGEFAADLQARLCWEMVYLCNRELVIDQVDFADLMAVRASLARVHAYLNMGLEYLSGHDTQQPELLLAAHPLRDIFHTGFTLGLRLRRRALRIQRHLHCSGGVRRALSAVGRRVLDGLLLQQPQFFVGLAEPGHMAYRDFLHVQDVDLTDPVLTGIEHDPAYDLSRIAA